MGWKTAVGTRWGVEQDRPAQKRSKKSFHFFSGFWTSLGVGFDMF